MLCLMQSKGVWQYIVYNTCLSIRFTFFHTMSLLLECVDHNACANEKELFMDEVPHLIVECTTGASTEMADPKRVRGVDMKLTMLMR